MFQIQVLIMISQIHKNIQQIKRKFQVISLILKTEFLLKVIQILLLVKVLYIQDKSMVNQIIQIKKILDHLKDQLLGIMQMLVLERKIKMVILFIHNQMMKTVLHKKNYISDLQKVQTHGIMHLQVQNKKLKYYILFQTLDLIMMLLLHKNISLTLKKDLIINGFYKKKTK